MFHHDPSTSQGAVVHAIHCWVSQSAEGGGQKVDDPLAPYPYRVWSHGGDQGSDDADTYQKGGVIVWGGDDLWGVGDGGREHLEGETQDENLYLNYQGVALSHVQIHESDQYALICVSQRKFGRDD